MAGKAVRGFLRGAAILSIAGLLSKILGSVYRVILTRILGADGIGLFELAYPIYVTLLTISRSGIPVALARLIAQAEARQASDEALSIFRTARFFSVVVGIFFTALLMLSSRFLIQLLGWDPRVFPSVMAIAPAIFFVSIMAAYRGYFQGFQRMGPTGISQVIEQAVRMVTMVILVLALIPLGVEYAAAGATFGAVSGAVAGLLVMLWYFKRSGHAPGGLGFPGGNDIIGQGQKIGRVALPVTIGALVFPLMRLVDAAIIPSRLQVAGWSITEATPLYGTLATALVLVNFPTILTVALAASLVPAISQAHALQEQELMAKRINMALRLAVLIGLPSALGLYVLAYPLCRIIFDLAEAALPLQFVAWGVLFISLQQTTSAILQGVGLAKKPAINLLVGAFCNGLVNFFLTAHPAWGIQGAALGTTLGFFVACLLNLKDVFRYTKPRLNWSLYLPPVLAGLGMALALHPVLRAILWVFRVPQGVEEGYGYVLAVLTTVGLGAVLFFCLLFLFRGVTREDMEAIPVYGEGWSRKLDNLKLLRRL